MWSAQVPKAQQRKMDILSAGREGRAPDLDSPLTDEERGWLSEVMDPTSVAYHWWYCANRCQFEIRDSALWSHGYLLYDATGSGLSVGQELFPEEVALCYPPEFVISSFTAMIRAGLGDSWSPAEA